MNSNFYYGDPQKEFEEVRKLIGQHLSTDYFNISFRYQLSALPTELGAMEELRELLINYCYRFKAFPESVAELKQLKNLQVTNGRQDVLPENLGKIPNLERLSLAAQSYKKRTEWAELEALTALKSLDLSSSLQHLKALPEAVYQLGDLEFLYLSNNNLRKLDDGLRQLKKLRVLDLGQNYFNEIPALLTDLPQLEELHINAQALEHSPEILLQMPNLKNIIVTGKDAKRYPKVRQIEKLFEQVVKRGLSVEYSAFLLEVLEHKNQLEALDEAELLELLNSNLDFLCVSALEQLEQKLSQSNASVAVQENSYVVVKGKIAGKKSAIKQRMKSLGIKTGIKLKKGVTHVILGQFPGLSWRELQQYPDLIVLTEGMLLKALNQLEMPYLLESKVEENTFENIRNLLFSESDEHILLAFELLHGGGCPASLLTELFLVYKKSSSPKIRREALYFLEQIGPPGFGLAVKRRLKIFGRWVSEATIRKNLEYYCNAGNLDARRIVDYLFEKTKKGASYALMHFSLDDKKAFFAQDLKAGILDLSMLGLETLPLDLPQMGTIRELDLSANHFVQFPDILFTQMKNLEILHMRNMYYIGQFPHRLLQIPSLKVIKLSTRHRNLPSEKELKAAGVKIEYVSPYKDRYI